MKRTLAIFISLCMAFTGLAPTAAFAQEGSGVPINMPGADVTVTSSDTRPTPESSSDGFLDENFLDDDFFGGGFSDTDESIPESVSESVPESTSASVSESVSQSVSKAFRKVFPRAFRKVFPRALRKALLKAPLR